MSTSPTQLSLAHLRREGWTCEVVERWNSFTKTRHDLFGFVDILAVREGETIAVQATSNAHVSERCHKIQKHPNYPVVVSAGWQVVVHGWKQRAKGFKWELRTVDLSPRSSGGDPT